MSDGSRAKTTILDSLRFVELGGLGPGPFAATILADMGADVVRVDRVDEFGYDQPNPPFALLRRGRRSIAVDLKRPEGRDVVLRLVADADGLVEGFRPGVVERLGIGPDACFERNPRLVYGRVTGWGQEGPYALVPGHDINYIALSGALAAGTPDGERPVPPLNLVGDFGGGGLLLAVGLLSALIERESSGLGQVVDAAMVDGSALLTTAIHSQMAFDRQPTAQQPGAIDGSAPFYGVYKTKDDRYISIGATDRRSREELARRIGLPKEEVAAMIDRRSWPTAKERLAKIFGARTRSEWCDVLEGTEACFAPVLTISEAPNHPHNRHRGTFVELDGVVQPAPAPRFDHALGVVQLVPARVGEHTDEVLLERGFRQQDLDELRAARAIA